MKDTIWLINIALGSCNATNETCSWILMIIHDYEYFQMNWHMIYMEMTSTGDDIDHTWCFKQYHSYVVMTADHRLMEETLHWISQSQTL